MAQECNLIATFKACLLLSTQTMESITRLYLFWVAKTGFCSNVKKVANKEIFF